jgi:hypothetical protein
MTEQDRSAPLSVEQEIARVRRIVCSHQVPAACGAPCGCSSCGLNRSEPKCLPCKVVADSIRAAHAEGVRTGRRQALEEAAVAVAESGPVLSYRQYAQIADWLRARATRGDEAHPERISDG